MFDDDAITDRFGPFKGLHQVGLIGDAGGHALAVVAVVGFDNYGIPQPLGVLDGTGAFSYHSALGHGDTRIVQHYLGEALVSGGFYADQAGVGGHGRLDTFLIFAFPELDQIVIVQPKHGNAAKLGLPNDGRRRRSQIVVVPNIFQFVDGGVEIIGFAGQQAVDDVDRFLPSEDAGVFHPIAEDDMERAAGVGIHGFSEADIHISDVLQFQGDVLYHMSQQGPFAHAHDQTALYAFGTAVIVETGNHLQQVVHESTQLVGKHLIVFAQIDGHHNYRAITVDIGAS